MAKRVSLEDMMYKPLLFKTEEAERYIIIFGSETTTREYLSPSGRKVQKKKTTLHAFDITTTAIMGQPAIQAIEVSSLAKFKRNMLDVKMEDVIPEIQVASTVIMNSINNMTNQM